jgi:putative SOS response-associated peptidase YedK
MLRPEGEEAWLNLDTPEEELLKLLVPYPAGEMNAGQSPAL